MFNECTSLIEIKIPSNIKSIRNYAFNKCKSIKIIEIPSSVINIGQGAFSDCISLENVIINASIQKIKTKPLFEETKKVLFFKTFIIYNHAFEKKKNMKKSLNLL